MVPLCYVRSRWPYVVLVAILIQLVLFLQKQPDPTSSEAKSAISRAVTGSCKKELVEFARKIEQDVSNTTVTLRRSCKRDVNKQRLQKIGCVTNSTSGLVHVEESVINATNCYELCFSFSHSHAGFKANTGDCYCGGSDTSHSKVYQPVECLSQEEFDWYRIDVGVFRPNRAIELPKMLPSNSRIRIAFLLIVRGRSNVHIQRLIRAIYSKEHVYYIHVDKRDEFLFRKLIEYATNYENIFVTPQRFETIWGGPSLLRMILDAISHLLKHRWDYLINLSESDFPVKPLSALEDYLNSTGGTVHLKLHNIAGYNFIKKQGLDRNFYQCEGRVWLMGKRQLPRGIVISGGSDWFALPRDFCQYISEQTVSSSKELVKPLIALYNQTILPVESFFHTVALNSHFCDRFRDNNLRITNWNRKLRNNCQHRDVVDWCGYSPLVYRWADWAKLKQTNSSRTIFFTRKFNPRISTAILELVERHLIKREPIQDFHNIDTRYWESIYERDFDTLSYNSEVMETFGYLSFRQLQLNENDNSTNLKLEIKSAHAYFDQDKFVGYILELCDIIGCTQLQVKEIDKFKLLTPAESCFNGSHKSLKLIEVNHGFDTGERTFLNQRPMDEKSNVAVYHEWIVNLDNSSMRDQNDTVQFRWRNPRGKTEFLQRVTLKGTNKPSRLKLAHRLSIPGPLVPGLWSLVVLHRKRYCLSYRFLVFGNSLLIDKDLNQRVFNKFYTVDDVCRVNKTKESPYQDCADRSWSMESKKFHGGAIRQLQSG